MKQVIRLWPIASLRCAEELVANGAQRTWPDLLLALLGREWTLNGHESLLGQKHAP